MKVDTGLKFVQESLTTLLSCVTKMTKGSILIS